MKLYCARHGPAAQLPNAMGEKPLTLQGRQIVLKVGAYLCQRGVRVSQVWHSPKLRAQETAKLLRAAIAPAAPMETCLLLGPQSFPEDLVSLLEELQEDTLLVGHMPCMSELVSILVGSVGEGTPLYFWPGMVVCLEREEKNRWIVRWALSPDLV